MYRYVELFKRESMGLQEKPYIFLDIDGTISSSIHSIDPAVENYLTALALSGYMLIFVTGRSPSWAKKALSFLDAPFILAVQNGAVISAMPEERIIKESYFHKSALSRIDALGVGKDYVVYTGFEDNFRCYYRKKRFSDSEKELLLGRSLAIGEVWVEVESFAEMPVETFPAIKFFGDKDSLYPIAETLEKSLNLFMPVISDPVLIGGGVAQGTVTNKGDVVDIVLSIYGKRPIIAAGDDMNDYEMLKKADIKLAIETAPQKILDLSDIICPAAKDAGIIEGLDRAIALCTK